MLLIAALTYVSLSTAYAADLVLSPASGTFEAGDTFTIAINVTNNSQSINAISGALTFPTNLLSVESLSKDGSIIKLWAEEPSFSNTNGNIKFEGVVLNPGFSGSKGKVLTIVFKAKASGDASALFSTGSVLANDGEATNVIQNLGNGSYTIVKSNSSPSVSAQATPAPEILSPSYPDSNSWYSTKDAVFTWNLPKDITSVRTVYGVKEDAVPTKLYEPPISGKSFKVDGDGIQYMTVQFKDESGWGKISHYKFQVDYKPPEALRVVFPDGTISVNPKPTISVEATDELSGISSILAVIDSQATTTFQISQNNLYQLPESTPGKHVLTVHAADKAGNISSVALNYTIVEITPPIITEYTKKAQVGDKLTVSGTTYPLSLVEVVYTNQDGVSFAGSATSTSEGIFNVLFDTRISADAYELKARVTDPRGAVSAYSQPKVVVVKRQNYMEIGIFIVNWLSLILVAIIAFACIIGAMWYSFVQFSRFRRKVKRTMAEIENTLRANVAALRRDTEEFHGILVKAEKKRTLTKEEQAILKKFKKRLEITEQEIEKKLEQIG